VHLRFGGGQGQCRWGSAISSAMILGRSQTPGASDKSIQASPTLGDLYQYQHVDYIQQPLSHTPLRIVGALTSTSGTLRVHSRYSFLFYSTNTFQ
jgi:hypothetical protein